MTNEQEMVAAHKKGRNLARAGMSLPKGASEAMRAGHLGELRRMDREREPTPPQKKRP